MVQLFNKVHITYLVTVLVVTVAVLILAGKFIKKPKGKDIFLKSTAWITFILHISILWVDFLKNGTATAKSHILFPIYFCNFTMYLLMIVAMMKNKQSKTFKFLAAFTAYAGYLGSIVTAVYPDTYLGHYYFDWNILRSMASHATMGIGCLYLFIGGYVKIRVKNVIAYFGGLVLASMNGLFINQLFSAFNLPSPNSMFMVKPPVASMPYISCYVVGLLMLILVFAFTAFWELFTLKKSERWHRRLPAYIKEVKLRLFKPEAITTEQAQNAIQDNGAIQDNDISQAEEQPKAS